MLPADTGVQVYELAGSADWNIDQASFDQLLRWLSVDPDTAGERYEVIRRKLIRLFASRRCIFAEDLADETFNRVARKLPQIKESYVGNQLSYFYGVAKKVYLEYLRCISRQRRPSLLMAEGELEEMFEHLEKCLSQLSHQDRELILTYYQGIAREKIDNRKKLAQELEIPLSALRLRAHRIVSRLRNQFNRTFKDTVL